MTSNGVLEHATLEGFLLGLLRFGFDTVFLILVRGAGFVDHLSALLTDFVSGSVALRLTVSSYRASCHFIVSGGRRASDEKQKDERSKPHKRAV